MEADDSRGGIITELDVETLTENLMRTLIALDEIYGEDELKLQRRELVLTLDLQKHKLILKIIYVTNIVCLKKKCEG